MTAPTVTDPSARQIEKFVHEAHRHRKNQGFKGPVMVGDVAAYALSALRQRDEEIQRLQKLICPNCEGTTCASDDAIRLVSAEKRLETAEKALKTIYEMEIKHERSVCGAREIAGEALYSFEREADA